MFWRNVQRVPVKRVSLKPSRQHIDGTTETTFSKNIRDENNTLVQLSKERLRNERVGASYWAVSYVILGSLSSLHLQSQSQNWRIYPTSIQAT